jgi:ABC-type sulfate transport system substrate-binding protein
VRDQGEDKNKKWMDLKKSVARASETTFMQEKAIDFLKEAAAKERSEALKAASAAASIETVTTTTTVSQQSTSSVVTVVAAATTPLMASQIFRDFLISTRSKKLPIHDSIKKIASHIAHEYTMNFRVKDKIPFGPFNGGKWQEWTRAINTKGRGGGGLTPICAALYATCKWFC